jgi:arginyl-tRNA synthetase
MTIKEERGREWTKINDAFDELNLVKAQTAMDSLEVMIQGEPEAEADLKEFNDKLAEKNKAEYDKIAADIKKWDMDESAAGNYFSYMDGKIQTRNVEVRRKNLFKLARKYDLFVLGE